jgi:signal transduction histidine kinase
MTIPISMGLGYTLVTYIMERKDKLDKSLLHIIKEIIHEINIPISTINANISMIKKSHKEHQKTLIRANRIELSTLRLQRLYQELVYGIKKEITTIPKSHFNLEEMLRQRVDIMMDLQRNKIILKDIKHLEIYADKIGFEKVIDNILHNSMKYSSIESDIIVELNGTNLSIKDFGIGIDETKMIQIFERYFQEDIKNNGKGIGLALVKNYCDSENITIDIKSQKDKGTNIILDIKSIIFDKINL